MIECYYEIITLIVFKLHCAIFNHFTKFRKKQIFLFHSAVKEGQKI